MSLENLRKQVAKGVAHDERRGPLPEEFAVDGLDAASAGCDDIIAIAPQDVPDFIEAGAGPLAVLVHSSLSGARQWSALAGELEDGFRVRAINVFGYGWTPAWSKARPPSLDDYADLVAAAIPRGAKRVHLVGHSMGGAVAMCAAARQLRGKVASLVLIAPSVFFLLCLSARHKAHAEIAAVLQRIRQLVAAGRREAAAQCFIDYWSGTGTWTATPPERQAAFARMTELVLPWEANALLQSPHGLSSDWIAELPEDTLLMCSDDTPRPSREIVQLLAQARPDWALARIADAGHMAPLTHPELVNRTIKAFMTSVAVGAGLDAAG